MANFEPYRSRKVIWAKTKVNNKGETIYYSKEGKTFPAEYFNKEWEKLDARNDTSNSG